MKKYPTNYMQTGKCNACELGFLKSLGWEVVDAWLVRGDVPVMVEQSCDRYTKGKIVDIRYTPDTREDEYIRAYLQA